MKKSIFVSVVIPTHNRKLSLKTCLQSLIFQSYLKQYFEIIVVDDGSRDGTKELVRRFITESEFNVYYFYQKNQGPSAARNLGIKMAKGEIIAFIDDDCQAQKNWLKLLIGSYSKNSVIVGVTGRVKVLNPGSLVEKYTDIFLFTNESSKTKNIQPPVLSGGNCSYRADALKQFKFDRKLRLGEDIDLGWRLYLSGQKLLYNPGAVVYHPAPKNIFQLMVKYFYCGCGSALVQNKNRKILSKQFKPPAGSIFAIFLEEIKALVRWHRRLAADYHALSRAFPKEWLLFILLPSLNFLTYRSYSLGIFYQTWKLKK